MEPAAGPSKERVVHRLTRRDVLRASAGAAAAVPIATLGVNAVEAAPDLDTELEQNALLDRVGRAPVVFAIHDPRRGVMSILRGTKEVRIRNRRLVARILRAARASDRRLGRRRGRANEIV
jgi:hypothetical protein